MRDGRRRGLASAVARPRSRALMALDLHKHHTKEKRPPWWRALPTRDVCGHGYDCHAPRTWWTRTRPASRLTHTLTTSKRR